MIVSFKGDDGLVHGAYISHESVPYVLAMTERKSNTWCLCSEQNHGLAVAWVEPLTCVACMIVRLYHGYKWHSMVTG